MPYHDFMLLRRKRTHLIPSSQKVCLSAPSNGIQILLPLPMSPRPPRRAVHQMHNIFLDFNALNSSIQRIPHWAMANVTLSLLKGRYWWPNMAREVRRFVQVCEECAISKSPRHLPAGKLLPLSVPNRPWSHLGVDFVTNLSASEGNTCILVVVDRFSKSCHLIPLKNLPTAMETAEQMFNHVFRYFGIPKILYPTVDLSSFPEYGRTSSSS